MLNLKLAPEIDKPQNNPFVFFVSAAKTLCSTLQEKLAPVFSVLPLTRFS
jgi:hypothetical protein